jgi:hypothetical protein
MSPRNTGWINPMSDILWFWHIEVEIEGPVCV